MKKAILAAVIGLSLAAAAQPRGMHGMKEGKHHRMRMVLGIAEALDLSESEALKLSEKLKTFDEKRKNLFTGLKEAHETLRAAAEGKADALPKVDAATAKVLDGRQQMAALDKEIFQSLSAGLTPEKKAKLALFLARAHAERRGPPMPHDMPPPHEE